MNSFHLSLENSLASFFCQKMVSFKDSIALKPHGSRTPIDIDLLHSGEALSDFTPVTQAEVFQLLRSMSNKSLPFDYIPILLQKPCADTFSILTSHLANISFTQATFPSKFKLALISLLLKKSGLPKSDLANFRPISNLNTIGETLERLALTRFFPHISKSPSFHLYSLLIANFIPWRLHCLNLQTISWKTLTLENLQFSLLWIWPQPLIIWTTLHFFINFSILWSICLSGYVISWIRSHRTDHSSFVKIDSSFSRSTNMLTGVPQGFDLGPLFFVFSYHQFWNAKYFDQSNQNSIVSFH